MRIFLSASALFRPFEDLSSARIQQEAEDVHYLIYAATVGKVQLLYSDATEFEIAQNPDTRRRRRIPALLGPARSRVKSSGRVVARARELQRSGFRALDALEIAAAESGQAQFLVTTDPRTRTVSGRGIPLGVRVVGPGEAMLALAPSSRKTMLTLVESMDDDDAQFRGWNALVEKLGPAGALRFRMFTEPRYVDYGCWRHRMLGTLSVDELVRRMRRISPALLRDFRSARHEKTRPSAKASRKP